MLPQRGAAHGGRRRKLWATASLSWCTQLREDGRRSNAALTQAQVMHEGHIYKGANHGFHNDTTPRYDEAAAEEAWQRTLDWFNKYPRA